MSKCSNCNVEILDEAKTCPLCKSVLEQTDELENMYPNVGILMKKPLLFSRIYLFCAIVAQSILVGINILASSQIWWSIITGLGLLYGYVVLRYAILGKAGYRTKVVLLSVIAILSAVAIDFVTGYNGWSVDYFMPSGILLVDAVILLCMVINRRNWQSYIMWQLLMIIISLIPIILFVMDLEQNPYMAFLPGAISFTIFLGTIIIGDRRARLELKRRFHVN